MMRFEKLPLALAGGAMAAATLAGCGNQPNAAPSPEAVAKINSTLEQTATNLALRAITSALHLEGNFVVLRAQPGETTKTIIFLGGDRDDTDRISIVAGMRDGHLDAEAVRSVTIEDADCQPAPKSDDLECQRMERFTITAPSGDEDTWQATRQENALGRNVSSTYVQDVNSNFAPQTSPVTSAEAIAAAARLAFDTITREA